VWLNQTAIEDLRAMVLARGAQQLAVGDLRADEVAGLAWSGNAAHLRSIAAALDQAPLGLEDYLVARAPTGQPVAKMRIDYTREPETGVFSQLATMGPLQGLGIATTLIGTGERRVRARGLDFAALGVEDNNLRARRLYERLGYQASGRQHPSWETEDDDGVLRLYETTLTILRKRLRLRALNARRPAVKASRPGAGSVSPDRAQIAHSSGTEIVPSRPTPACLTAATCAADADERAKSLRMNRSRVTQRDLASLTDKALGGQDPDGSDSTRPCISWSMGPLPLYRPPPEAGLARCPGGRGTRQRRLASPAG
jgi:ribosomal protein S18 acetylase RimI-like enzyme